MNLNDLSFIGEQNPYFKGTNLATSNHSNKHIYRSYYVSNKYYLYSNTTTTGNINFLHICSCSIKVCFRCVATTILILIQFFVTLLSSFVSSFHTHAIGMPLDSFLYLDLNGGSIL